MRWEIDLIAYGQLANTRRKTFWGKQQKIVIVYATTMLFLAAKRTQHDLNETPKKNLRKIFQVDPEQILADTRETSAEPEDYRRPALSLPQNLNCTARPALNHSSTEFLLWKNGREKKNLTAHSYITSGSFFFNSRAPLVQLPLAPSCRVRTRSAMSCLPILELGPRFGCGRGPNPNPLIMPPAAPFGGQLRWAHL